MLQHCEAESKRFLACVGVCDLDWENAARKRALPIEEDRMDPTFWKDNLLIQRYKIICENCKCEFPVTKSLSR